MIDIIKNHYKKRMIIITIIIIIILLLLLKMFNFRVCVQRRSSFENGRQVNKANKEIRTPGPPHSEAASLDLLYSAKPVRTVHTDTSHL